MQFSVEALPAAGLPRTSWLDVNGLRANSGDPLTKRNSNKPRTVTGMDVRRNAARDGQLASFATISSAACLFLAIDLTLHH